VNAATPEPSGAPKRRKGLTVVKLGGSLLEDRTLRLRALESIAARFTAGGKTVVVHGGGKRIDATLQVLKIPKKTYRGLRITDPETLDVVVSVLSGLVNKSLIAELRSLGILSAGLSGADGDTLWAEFHPRVDGVDFGFVGRVTYSNPQLLNAVLGAGLLPVVASVALGREGTLLNVNADSAAAALAAALRAESLVFLTDVAGLLDAGGNVVPELDPATAWSLIRSGAVAGGMRPKLLACLDAVHAGVGEIFIAGPAGHAAALASGSGGTRLAAL
jgi:acetylglutamate kinase